MDPKDAVGALSALAHESRLSIFRMLVQAGGDGIAAGEIARRLAMLPNTLSANLNILSHARLIESRREGRGVIYTARYAQMAELLEFLIEDCCSGQPDICSPLADVVLRSRCRPGGRA